MDNHLFNVKLKKGRNILAVKFLSGNSSALFMLGGPKDLRNIVRAVRVTEVLSSDNFDKKLPRKNLFKRYYAELDQPAVAEDIFAFANGMEFREFSAKPARLEIDPVDPRKVYVEIAEGKYHQVKRMCEKVGKTVLFLKRIAIGELQLDEALKCGQMRELTPGELSLFSSNK